MTHAAMKEADFGRRWRSSLVGILQYAPNINQPSLYDGSSLFAISPIKVAVACL